MNNQNPRGEVAAMYGYCTSTACTCSASFKKPEAYTTCLNQDIFGGHTSIFASTELPLGAFVWGILLSWSTIQCTVLLELYIFLLWFPGTFWFRNRRGYRGTSFDLFFLFSFLFVYRRHRLETLGKKNLKHSNWPTDKEEASTWPEAA